jgi:chromosome condensin MukBEF MukE localization factor
VKPVILQASAYMAVGQDQNDGRKIAPEKHRNKGFNLDIQQQIKHIYQHNNINIYQGR